MKAFGVLGVLFGVLNLALSFEESQIVTTAKGQYEGYMSPNGFYYEFLGVRYGIPQKFRGPTEVPAFKGVFKANSRAVTCAQGPSTDVLSVPSENEDCLVLNIYTPANFQSNVTLPTMVFLHGGDFGVGCGSPFFYGPQYLVYHNVTVVTVNYRLNCDGFLNLGMKEAPGNAGLKDIRAALRWVKQNIKSFGGDPDNVTVFGQNAGATAAMYLTMSASTKNLFNRIICQSGSVFTPYAFDPVPFASAVKAADALGVKTEDPQRLYKLFANTPKAKLVEALAGIYKGSELFVPSVEVVFEGEEPFLLDTPYNILATGPNHPSFHPVPAIAGHNVVEGLTSILNKDILVQINAIAANDFTPLEPRSLTIPTSADREIIHKILQQTYFANATTNEQVISAIINMDSDFSCVGPLQLFTDLYATNSKVPIYSYIFQHVGDRNLGRILTNTTVPASTNLDELFYLFELERSPLPLNERDIKIVALMTTLWTTFAKNGVPSTDVEGSGEWVPYPYHLSLESEPKYVGPLTPERTMMLWRDIYFKYGADIRV